jgi:hypothetical protein
MFVTRIKVRQLVGNTKDEMLTNRLRDIMARWRWQFNSKAEMAVSQYFSMTFVPEGSGIPVFSCLVSFNLQFVKRKHKYSPI